MRRLVLALGIFGAIIAPAMAADVHPAKAPAVVAAPVNWTGFYVGINSGAGMYDASISDPDCDMCVHKKFQTAFATVGGQVGYNWQMRAMVLGVEGDLNWASAKASDTIELCCAAVVGTARTKFDAFASIRGRMGMAFDNALVYVTAGPAFGHFKSSTVHGIPDTNGFRFSNDNGWHPGIAVGTGAEFMLASNWTLRGEYLFLQFQDVANPQFHDQANCAFGTFCRVNYAYSAHVARLGLNYRFGY